MMMMMMIIREFDVLIMCDVTYYYYSVPKILLYTFVLPKRNFSGSSSIPSKIVFVASSGDMWSFTPFGYSILYLLCLNASFFFFFFLSRYNKRCAGEHEKTKKQARIKKTKRYFQFSFFAFFYKHESGERAKGTGRGLHADLPDSYTGKKPII